MDDQPDPSDQDRISSPWPLIIMLGLVFSELGLLFNVFPVAVGGLLVFIGSVVSIILESGYAERPWNLLLGLGLVLVMLGGILTAAQIDAITLDAFTSIFTQPNSIVDRGAAMLVAGIAVVLAGTGGRFVETESV